MTSHRKILRSLVPYTRPHLPRLVLLFVLALGQMAIQLLRPWPLKLALDGLVAHKDSPAWLDALVARTSTGTALAVLAFCMIIFVAINGVLQVISLYQGVRLGHAMVGDLRSALYQHLQKLSLCFHKKQAMGDLIKRVAVDTFAVQSLLANQVLPTLIAGVMIVCMTVVMALMDWPMAFLALAVAPAMFLTIKSISKRLDRDAREAQEADSRVYQTVQEGLSAIVLVQATNQEFHQLRGFQQASERGLRANLRLYMTQARFGFIVDLITASGTAALMLVGVQHVQQGRLTVGELWVFFAYLASLYAPINTIAQNISWAQASLASLGRVFEVLDKQPDILDSPHAKTLPKIAGDLAFENVSYAYEPGRPVLKNVSFRIRPGQRVAVVGSTGSGKSTLLGLTMRFFDPQEGRILLDGKDIRDYKVADIRDQMTLVLQDPVLLAMSVEENLRFGAADRSDEEVMEASRQACADDFVRQLPEGYKTVLAQAGVTLSGGQRQRLGLARSFLRSTPLILLDEPTSALDVSTESKIMRSLAQYAQDRTCLIVTHRLGLARQADVILMMENGEIVETGSHDRLVRANGPYARLWDDAQRQSLEAAEVAG